jgi:hypothetical protein
MSGQWNQDVMQTHGIERQTEHSLWQVSQLVALSDTEFGGGGGQLIGV